MIKRFYWFLLILGMWGSAVVYAQERLSTAAENVLVLEEPFQMPGLDRSRTIRLYFPPNYDASNKNYPVLYMHDGQNLFDDATSYVGEWGVDEILNELYQEQGFELIVVGIDNGQEKRMHELTAWDHEKYGKAEGKEYMDFIVKTVKPYIDSNYRTLASRENTAIMGSSLGGLISHYGIFQYPEIFSKAGIFSPSYWWGEGPFLQAQTTKLPSDTQLFMLMGGKEGLSMLNSFNLMINLFEASGYGADQMTSKINPAGEHNERFWNSEFREAVLWLYGK